MRKWAGADFIRRRAFAVPAARLRSSHQLVRPLERRRSNWPEIRPKRSRAIFRPRPKRLDTSVAAAYCRPWSIQEARLLLIIDRELRYSLSFPSLIIFPRPFVAHPFVYSQEI